jgi:Trk K+ transport system NAD-binding subunit
MSVDPLPSQLTGHLIVCGLGHVGYRVVCLLARLGERGIVITREASEEWRAATEAHFPVLIGDARNDKILRQAGIDSARGIIAVTDEDLANVSIALDARRINPKIAIVIRILDPDLALHLKKSIEINRALSASILAAPAFEAAALGATVRGTFETGGKSWIIEEHQIDGNEIGGAGTCHDWTTQTSRAVIALQHSDQTVLRPSAVEPLRPGDRLLSLGLAQPASRRSGPWSRLPGMQTGMPLRRVFSVGLLPWWREVPRALRTTLGALLIFVALSVVVFRFGLGLSLVDSLYFVVTTITTVGYGDFSLKEASPLMKLYGSFVMLCGAAIIAMLFGLLTDLILRSRLREVFARGYADYQGHIIVAGTGDFGYRLVKDLAGSGETVVAIAPAEKEEFLQTVRDLAGTVPGNPRLEETLRKAGVAGARAIVAAQDDDLANLSIGLAAKRANASCRVVLRLFDAELAEKMQRGLGIDAVLSVSAAAAPTFVGALFCPEILQGLLLPSCLIAVFQRRIEPGRDGIECRECSLGKNESALFVKRAGSGTFAALASQDTLHQGDEIIGTRWYCFQTRAESG